MCAHMSALASTQVIIMCVHRQQPVCLSTLTTKSLYCVHVYMYVHSFIAFDPCMCTCQSSTKALCGVGILAATIHIACIGIYIHVSISFNPSQHLSCMSMHIYNSNHLWTSTYMSAFVPFTFQCMGTCQSSTLFLVENNLNVCSHVSIGFNASPHHVCTSTTACMSEHIYYKVSVLRPCLHVSTFLHCL